MNRQRDACGLIAFADEDRRSACRASARRGHLHSLLLALEQLAPGAPGGRSDGPCIKLADALQRRSLVVLISDLLDDPEPIIAGLKHLKFSGSDVHRLPAAGSRTS